MSEEGESRIQRREKRGDSTSKRTTEAKHLQSPVSDEYFFIVLVSELDVTLSNSGEKKPGITGNFLWSRVSIMCLKPPRALQNANDEAHDTPEMLRAKQSLFSWSRNITNSTLYNHRLTTPYHHLRRSAVPPIIRTLSVTTHRPAELASHLPAKPTVVLSAPSPEYLHQNEMEVDLLPPEEVRLVITDRAAQQLMMIAAREGNSDAALRIAVESGGCHGYQYKMELADKRSGDDYHFTHPTLKPSNIFVDAVSLPLLNGSTIDFATELIGSSFRINNNPQAKGSGCGCGVSWELKE